MTEQVFYPTTANDDATEDSGTTMYLALTYLRPDSGWYAGIRFQSVTVANAEPILYAYLKINVLAANNVLSFVAHCEDADTSAIFASSASNISGRTLTTASTTVGTAGAITVGGGGYFTVDVTSAVQEVVDRGSWASGNDMSVILVGGTGANGRFYSYDNTTLIPSLTIITSTPGATGKAGLHAIEYGAV